MRRIGHARMALVMNGLMPLLQGCAQLAGLEDRVVGSHGAGGSGGGGGSCQAGGGSTDVPAPVPIAEMQNFPLAVRVDEEAVYWTNQGPGAGITQWIKPEGPHDVLESIPQHEFTALALDEERIYWSDKDLGHSGDCTETNPRDRVWAMQAEGEGEPVELWSGCGLPQVVAATSERVYWARPENNRLQYIEKEEIGAPDPPGREVVRDSGSEPAGIAVDPDTGTVYFTDRKRGQIFRYDEESDPTPLPPTALDQPGLIVLDERDIYWLTANEVMRYAKDGSDSQPQVLASDLGKPEGIAVHDGYVYFTDSENGAVYRVHRDGCPAEQIATAQDKPMGIAADATGVYWANYIGRQIMRQALR